LSNLLKYVPIEDPDNKRVINNNEALEEIVKEKMRQMQQMEDDAEFTPGLDAEEVDLSEYDEDGVPIVFEDEEGEEESASEPVNAAPGMDMLAYKEMADEILKNAYDEAARIGTEAKASAVAMESEARDRGYAEGLAKAEEDARASEEARSRELEAKKAELEAQYHEMMDEMEPQIVSVVADIFEKVFSIQFAGKKEILLNLVRNAVNQIENSKVFLIKVPKENLQFVMEHKEELQEKVGQYVSIEIISDGDLTDNQCIIETDSGVFDCSLDIQLDNLVRDLKSLSINVQS
jgi:flagellar assembly protein FliH